MAWVENSQPAGASLPTGPLGFGHIPVIQGAPTGTPPVIEAGFAPVVFDAVNSKLWIYGPAGWVAAALG